mmetsp:Transcript_43329/g.67606  ORF Transcript_43329/g.67606 Transcript_43329/m.67606 type:complete len:296 (-) Transcript_43329:2595-3482(-)
MSNYRPSRVKSCLKKCKTIRRPETKAGLTSDPCNTISRNRHKFHIDSPLVFSKQYHWSSTDHSFNANLLCEFDRIWQHDRFRIYICWRYTPADTSRSLQEPCNIFVICYTNNRSHWTVLRNEACCDTAPCGYNNCWSPRIQRAFDSRCGHVLSCAYSAKVSADAFSDIQIPSLIIEGSLCFFNYPTHNCNSLKWKVSTSSLSRKHYAISSVKHSICYISSFCTCWTRSLTHGFQHLRRCNTRLPMKIAFRSHYLLCEKNFLGWDLHAQIPTRNHNAITFCTNLIEVIQSFLIFDL